MVALERRAELAKRWKERGEDVSEWEAVSRVD